MEMQNVVAVVAQLSKSRLAVRSSQRLGVRASWQTEVLRVRLSVIVAVSHNFHRLNSMVTLLTRGIQPSYMDGWMNISEFVPC